MSPPPREIVPVEQMDNEIRPYFIHHRNQVGINTSLMDLFRLIDLFLKEDEEAREPLQALRIISDYIQRKHIVAPMPSELVNFYDDPHMAAESIAAGQNPLAELSRLLAPLTGSAAYPTSTTRQDQESHSALRISTGLSPGSDEREPVFHVPLGMPSPSRPARVDLALAFGDMPVPNLHQGQVLPLRAASNMAATDHRSALVVDVIREKLRSWLHRPETGALKRWVLKKCQKFQTEDDTWQFVDAYPADPWAGVAHRAGTQATEEISETSSTPTASFEPNPITFPHGGVRVTQDIVMHRDSPPSERQQSLSVSMARPLPPAPSQGGGHESSSNSSDPSATIQATVPSVPISASRTRKNSSATHALGSGPNTVAVSSISKSVPTVAAPPRPRRASLRERAASALFSITSDSSSTDPSLQAHLQAQLYSARFVAGISTPRPTIAPEPISTLTNAASTSRKPGSIGSPPKRVLPPQIHLDMGQAPDIPSITIQPPSRPQTLSTPSGVSPSLITASTSSSEQAYHSISSSSNGPKATPDAKLFRHSIDYVIPRSGPTRDAENTPPLRRHGSHRNNVAARQQEVHESKNTGHYTIRNGQNDAGVSPPDSEEEYQSTTHTVHHGLPTPKSVEDRVRLPATTPTVSLHENTIIPHHLQALGLTEAEPIIPRRFQGRSFDPREDTCIAGPDVHTTPLMSRFSFDSHFSASTTSTQGRSASPGSEFHSFSDATSHEGEFLAGLASRRKKSIRSGGSRPTRRTPSLLMSQSTVPEESVMPTHSPKIPTRVNERNVFTALGVGESSRSPQTSHRRVLSH